MPLPHRPSPPGVMLQDSASYSTLCLRRQRLWLSPVTAAAGRAQVMCVAPWHRVTAAGGTEESGCPPPLPETPRQLLTWSPQHFGWGPPVPAWTRALPTPTRPLLSPWGAREAPRFTRQRWQWSPWQQGSPVSPAGLLWHPCSETWGASPQSGQAPPLAFTSGVGSGVQVCVVFAGAQQPSHTRVFCPAGLPLVPWGL